MVSMLIFLIPSSAAYFFDFFFAFSKGVIAAKVWKVDPEGSGL
jgi:hypothetical protein